MGGRHCLSGATADAMSDDEEIRYAKTDRGVEEVRNQASTLPRKLRSALLLVFASKTAAQLQEQGAAIGAPGDFLEQLVAMGLIEPLGGQRAQAPATRAPQTPAERFIAASRFIEQSVANEAGLKAFFFQLKVQKCSDVGDLAALLPAYREFMQKHAGPESAAVHEAELRGLLGVAPG
jgi:hypothetical protein